MDFFFTSQQEIYSFEHVLCIVDDDATNRNDTNNENIRSFAVSRLR